MGWKAWTNAAFRNDKQNRSLAQAALDVLTGGGEEVSRYLPAVWNQFASAGGGGIELPADQLLAAYEPQGIPDAATADVWIDTINGVPYQLEAQVNEPNVVTDFKLKHVDQPNRALQAPSNVVYTMRSSVLPGQCQGMIALVELDDSYTISQPQEVYAYSGSRLRAIVNDQTALGDLRLEKTGGGFNTGVFQTGGLPLMLITTIRPDTQNANYIAARTNYASGTPALGFWDDGGANSGAIGTDPLTGSFVQCMGASTGGSTFRGKIAALYPFNSLAIDDGLDTLMRYIISKYERVA